MAKQFISFFTNLGQGFARLLYPSHFVCMVCDSELNEDSACCLCPKCKETLPYLNGQICEKCGSPEVMEGEAVCDRCKGKTMPFEQARAVFAYQAEIKALVHKFKYSGKTYLAKPLAECMADCLKLHCPNLTFDCIVPVPMFPAKKKKRGFNQAELLAKELSEIVKLPLELNGLARTIDNLPQTTLNFDERQKNLEQSFHCDKGFFKKKTVLLVDDVFTTGATARTVSEILKTQGKAENVFVLTVAHTPLY